MVHPGIHFWVLQNGVPYMVRAECQKLDHAGWPNPVPQFRLRLVGRSGGRNSSPEIQEGAATNFQKGTRFFQKWCEKSSKLVQKKTKMDQKNFRIDTGQIQEMLIFPLEFNDFRPRACPSCSVVLAQKCQKACEKKSKVVADFSPERRRFGRKWPARPGRSDRRSRAPALVAPRSAGRLRWALRFATGPAPQLCSAGCLFCWGCNIWPATRIQGQRICKGYFFSKAFPHASSRFLKIRRFISGAQCGNRAVRKRCHPAFDFILRYFSDTVVVCGGLR